MRFTKAVAIALTLTWTFSTALAQVTTSTILGTVTDRSGATIPDVRVTVKDVGTGFERVVTTGADGTYVVENLKPGQYQVSASKTGFNEKVISGITVAVDQRARIDVQLEVGAVTQRVEVQGAAPVVETDSSTVGKVITTRDVLELPLNGRNFIQLAVVTAGAQ